VKTIAFYLPQFHSIPENDKWWGNGYTEWVAVKKAVPLFTGHYQPHIPYKYNYYNLLEKDTMANQARLMEKYGIDGLCFYHYYFEKGRKVLERPAENLLKWSDINMPFCFSWANETWARTWSHIQTKNVWNSMEEKEALDDGILLKQKYGNEQDWIEHFDYLLPFFLDERYIKYQEKPIFIFHRADLISCLPQMMNVWNELSLKNGMQGIYFIGANTERKGLDGYIRQEPNYSDTFNQLRVSYDNMTDKVIRNAIFNEDDVYLCGFPSYDDTPRRGIAGKVMEGSTPSKFCEQMKKIYNLSKCRNQEFVFINAWNEWGEGMHLEPDEKFGYGYLEAVKRAQENYKEFESKFYKESSEYSERNMVISLQKETEKQKDVIRILTYLCSIPNLTLQLEAYFKKHGVKNLALYGFGNVGQVLTGILCELDVKVAYGIDQRAEKLNYNFPVYTLNEKLPEVDLIIVTLPIYFPVIYKDLCKINDAEIVSIDEILEEIEEYI